MSSDTANHDEKLETDVSKDAAGAPIEDSAENKAGNSDLASPQKSGSSPWLSWIYYPITIGLLLAVGITIGAFVKFAQDVASIKAPSDNPNVDAIVVLTGGNKRLTQAVGLLEDGVGGRLFISGVNPDISEDALRRASGANKQMFDCCIEFGKEAKDTSGNGLEISQWAEKNNYKSLAVVTSNYHMVRSLYELRKTNSSINYVAYPVTNTDLNTVNWFENPDVLKALIFEFTKLNIAHLRHLAASAS